MDTIVNAVENVLGINQEAPVEAPMVEAEVETIPEATPEVAVEAEAVDLGWQKGVHYF